MAEEAVAVQGESGSSESANVDQGGYLSDAFADSGYFDDPKAPEAQAKKPEDEETDPKAQAPKEEPKKPDEQVEKPGEVDPFEKAFSNEAGELDIERMMGVSLDGAQFQREPAQEVEQPADTTPAWQKELEEEKTYREGIETARLGPLQRAYELLEQGVDPKEALATAFNEAKSANEEFFKQRESELSAKRRQEELDKVRDEVRATKLPEIARANAFTIVNKLPGADTAQKIELYNRIMFGEDGGGALVEDMFVASHPDYKKYDEKRLKEAKIRFVNELQADPDRLQRHFDRAYRYMAAAPERMKKLMEVVARNKESQVRGNALAAQKNPQGAVARPAAKKTGAWDSYFAPPASTRTRI